MTYTLAWMFKTKSRIRLYTHTVWWPSKSSQHTVSGQWNVIRMSLRWRADGGPLLDVKQELRTSMSAQDSDQTVIWIKLRTVDNKTSHLLRGDITLQLKFLTLIL